MLGGPVSPSPTPVATDGATPTDVIAATTDPAGVSNAGTGPTATDGSVPVTPVPTDVVGMGAGGMGGVVPTATPPAGNADAAPTPVTPTPVDCSGFAATPYQLCMTNATACGVVFEDSAGCTAVCASAGLGCLGAFENVDGVCAADMTLPALACDSGHLSDFCMCGGPSTVPVPDPVVPDPVVPDPVVPDPVTPQRLPTGFASTNSNGLATTTGGGNLAPTAVTSCTQLQTLLESTAPQVLEIPQGMTLDCRTENPGTVGACQLLCSATGTRTFLRVPVTGQDCTTLADFNGDGTLEVPPGTLVNRPRSDFRIDVSSNKTLRGAGSGATLLGVSLNIDTQSNIIVQNLTLGQINPDLIEAGDGLTINTSHHVWVDHNFFSMISDGYMDIRFGSSAVTISNNHFDGANPFLCDGQHNFVTLVTDSEVTYDHNFFDHCGGRNPKVDGASNVHIYSNFYDSISFFCANSGVGSALLVEGNYFLNSSRPHWAEGGLIQAVGNVYAGSTSTDFRDNNGIVFTPPYPYTPDNVNNLPTTIPALVGPGQL